MGRRAAREGDIDNKKNVKVTGSPNVITNNRRAVREGDIDNKKNIMVVGSGTVIVNNRRACREGDIDNKKNTIVTGSNNVYMGDMSFNIDSAPAQFENMTEAQAVSVMMQVFNEVKKANDTEVVDLRTGTPLTAAPVLFYDYATVETDDEGAPTEDNELVTHTAKQKIVKAASIKENIDIDTPSNVEEQHTPTSKNPPVNSGYDYSDIDAATSFGPNFQLSPNIKLKDVTTNCRISKYELQKQFTGGQFYSEQMIVKNLRDLCYNIIEPLMQMYGGVIINSAFRHGTGKSQHERGQAVDIAFSGMDTDVNASFVRAKEISDSDLPYDQFIFEQNRSIWFHLSYDKSKDPNQRRMVMSKPKDAILPLSGLKKFV